MAGYVYLDKYSKKGKLGISAHVFDVLVEKAIHSVEGCAPSNKKLPASYKFRLKQAVRTTIRRGIVHVSVFVDIRSGNSIQEVSRKIEDEINTILLATTETIPFDVQVTVESII